MNVIIAGGRKFNNYELLANSCDYYLQSVTDPVIQILSGGAPGADALGERYANERDYHIMKFRAGWDKHGKKAGPMRNEEMAQRADALIAFWDGVSPGTRNMIE